MCKEGGLYGGLKPQWYHAEWGSIQNGVKIWLLMHVLGRCRGYKCVLSIQTTQTELCSCIFCFYRNVLPDAITVIPAGKIYPDCVFIGLLKSLFSYSDTWTLLPRTHWKSQTGSIKWSGLLIKVDCSFVLHLFSLSFINKFYPLENIWTE